MKEDKYKVGETYKTNNGKKEYKILAIESHSSEGPIIAINTETGDVEFFSEDGDTGLGYDDLNLAPKVAAQFPELPKGEEWHKSSYIRKQMREEGWRPLISGEGIDYEKDEFEINGGIWVKSAQTPSDSDIFLSHYISPELVPYRTKRPLPNPIKIEGIRFGWEFKDRGNIYGVKRINLNAPFIELTDGNFYSAVSLMRFEYRSPEMTEFKKQ